MLKPLLVAISFLLVSFVAKADVYASTAGGAHAGGGRASTSSGTTAATGGGTAPTGGTTTAIGGTSSSGGTTAASGGGGTPLQGLWSTGMEDGTMSAWYAGGGGGEFNGHPGSTAGSVGSDGSTSAASQEQAHSGAWSAKLTIPSNGACRLVRQLESQQYAELYYSAWYYFPQSYTLSGPGAFWMLMQWKSATATAHDPFFMLVAYSATPSTLNLGLAWFPLPVDGPLPGQSGYQLFPSNIQMPVGRWFQVETRYKSAGDFTGAIQMWIDGVEVYHMENVRTRYPDGNTIWSVTSYAQGLSPSPVVIYVDDAVISQTRPGQ